MPPRIAAAARTPWAIRHGALAGVRPERLLQSAIAAAADDAGLRIDRVLVGCDESVGAQHQNVARRVCLDLAWPEVPAMTVDGHGMTGLGLVVLASSLPGTTLVATVDATSLIPPGAGLVRDYGRPQHDEPITTLLERLALDAGLTRARLDEIAEHLRSSSSALTGPQIATVSSGRDQIHSDHVDDRVVDGELSPLVEGGIQTAFHDAEYADGAAAVVVTDTGGDGPVIENATTTAAKIDVGVTALAAELASRRDDRPVLVATPSAVIAAVIGMALLGTDPSNTAIDAVRPVLSAGTTPSGDGLRMLVDAVHRLDRACVVDPGGLGQSAFVSIERLPLSPSADLR
jgi:hypothetical protein